MKSIQIREVDIDGNVTACFFLVHEVRQCSCGRWGMGAAAAFQHGMRVAKWAAPAVLSG